MPIESITILKDAQKNEYGVAAFNIFNYETIAWVIQAAQESEFCYNTVLPRFQNLPMKVLVLQRN